MSGLIPLGSIVLQPLPHASRARVRHSRRCVRSCDDRSVCRSQGDDAVDRRACCERITRCTSVDRWRWTRSRSDRAMCERSAAFTIACTCSAKSVTTEDMRHCRFADVFVTTSQHEGFGLVFLEAMAFGLPVVCYDRGGQTDFLKSGETGFVVPLNDESAFTKAIIELYSDRDGRDVRRHNRAWWRIFSSIRVRGGMRKCSRRENRCGAESRAGAARAHQGAAGPPPRQVSNVAAQPVFRSPQGRESDSDTPASLLASSP